ncbi:MAG: hypothetical protein HPY57_13565 [Ignavibacteria bacterium]|nr:hypothetical protein [Ignavibacteria bacterium]
MANIKLELFNFKNKLNLEQLDVARIAQTHLENYDNLSEIELKESLNHSLQEFRYYPEVKSLLEAVQEEIQSMPLVYELKDLYKKIERKNHGVLYRPALVQLLETINKQDDDARMESILNELSIYDWIPEIKFFLMKMTTSPVERQNLKNSGKASKVFTLVEKVEEGHLTFVADRWFLITESEIKQVIADDYVKDPEKIRNIRMLEKVLQIAEIEENMINFKIDENLTLGISTKNNNVFLNGKKLDKETTLETLFNSPVIPYLKKDYYNLVESTINNINKFVELDIALKVTNLLNPFTESICFNYKDKMYIYNKDTRTGSKFYAYDNASELIHDVQKELDYDLTHFYENKLSKELKILRGLEDRERQIDIKLQDVNESIKMLAENEELIKENKELKLTYNNLLVYKHKLTLEMNEIKAKKSAARKTLLK